MINFNQYSFDPISVKAINDTLINTANSFNGDESLTEFFDSTHEIRNRINKLTTCLTQSKNSVDSTRFLEREIVRLNQSCKKVEALIVHKTFNMDSVESLPPAPNRFLPEKGTRTVRLVLHVGDKTKYKYINLNRNEVIFLKKALPYFKILWEGSFLEKNEQSISTIDEGHTFLAFLTLLNKDSWTQFSFQDLARLFQFVEKYGGEEIFNHLGEIFEIKVRQNRSLSEHIQAYRAAQGIKKFDFTPQIIKSIGSIVPSLEDYIHHYEVSFEEEKLLLLTISTIKNDDFENFSLLYEKAKLMGSKDLLDKIHHFAFHYLDTLSPPFKESIVIYQTILKNDIDSKTKAQIVKMLINMINRCLDQKRNNLNSLIELLEIARPFLKEMPIKLYFVSSGLSQNQAIDYVDRIVTPKEYLYLLKDYSFNKITIGGKFWEELKSEDIRLINTTNLKTLKILMISDKKLPKEISNFPVENLEIKDCFQLENLESFKKWKLKKVTINNCPALTNKSIAKAINNSELEKLSIINCIQINESIKDHFPYLLNFNYNKNW